MLSLFEKHGIKKEIAPWVKKRTALYLKYQEENSIPVIEGFKEFHQFLADNKVKVAVASSGHASHVKGALAKIGMPKIKVVAIEHVRRGRGKPHPDLFVLAAKKLKAKKGSAIVFEDAPAGIEAARRAKMPCVALSTSLPPAKLRKKAALVVKNFRSPALMRLFSLLLAKKGKLRPPQARGVRLSR
jgi:HAD superfamily hydrolase (TIGR01509 family)